MKNPAWQEPGAKLPQGHHDGIAASGPDNKFAPGEPGVTGNTDVAWSSVAPIRFKRDEPAPTAYPLGNVPD